MLQILREHIELANDKLKEAKPLVKLFALDYDGTIFDGVNYKHTEAMALIERILTQNKPVAFITARAATAIKTFVPLLQRFLAQKNVLTPVFIAGGNGTVLYKVTKDTLIKIYSYGLSLSEIIKAIDAWDKIYKEFQINANDLNEKGLATFQKFLKEDWTGYIPNQIIELSRPYEGKIFVEEAKVTFVLPIDKNQHEKVINNVKAELGNDYSVAAGDEIFAHITKRLKEDSKAIAIKFILKSLNLELNQVVTFGDMPTGNDVGLLSFPYSFTNSEEFIKLKKDLQRPPFILINSNTTAIGRVYKAIDYLLSEY